MTHSLTEQINTAAQESAAPAEETELLRHWPAEALLAANLEALAARDKELAQTIATVEIPAEVEMAAARDGSVSFRIRQADGRRRWLGNSSVPVIAAQAHLGRIKPGQANLVMCGLGCGMEAQMLLEKMPPYQALLVVEAEWLNLNLVFRLRDLTEFLANGRLVLLCGDEPGQLLEDFYRRHSGYNLIDQTIAWPFKPQRENHALAQQVTGVMQRCSRMVIRKIDTLLAEQKKYYPQAQPAAVRRLMTDAKNLRVLNCTSSYTPIDVCTSRDCLAGLKALGATVEHQVLNRADMLSPVAQLERLNRCRPHLIVLVDMLRADLKLPLPPAVVCVSILRRPGPALFEAQNFSRMSDNDFICPCLKEQAQQLKQAGLSPERIIYLPRATNTEIFRPMELPPADKERLGGEVVIIAGRCSTNPETYEINLPTHQRLWRQAAEDIRNAPEKYHYDRAGSFLRQAQKCGVELKEQDLLQYFTELIQNYLADTVLRDCYAEGLAREKVDLRIWSLSFQPEAKLSTAAPDWADSPVGHLAAGAISSGEDLNKLYNAGQILVHISSSGFPEQYVLDGIAAGAFFLVKSHPRDRRADGIAEFLEPGKEIITFDTPRDLVRKVRYYLEHEQERKSIAAHARQKLITRHTCQQRMCDMLKQIGLKKA